MAGTDPHKLTWAALLGRWVDFARSAVALPDDAEGRAWREAVPEIIGLQALAMALGEADQLDAEERALALDRSRILYRGHIDRLNELFGEDRTQWRPMLRELAEDAEQAIHDAERLTTEAADSTPPTSDNGGETDPHASNDLNQHNSPDDPPTDPPHA
jgi:hypothetical protein